MIDYEWCIETLDANSAFERFSMDIVDQDFDSRLRNLDADTAWSAIDGKRRDNQCNHLCLVRSEWDEHLGLTDRVYAYVTCDATLPDTFESCEGNRPNMQVPKRFHRELQVFRQCRSRKKATT